MLALWLLNDASKAYDIYYSFALHMYGWYPGAILITIWLLFTFSMVWSKLFHIGAELDDHFGHGELEFSEVIVGNVNTLLIVIGVFTVIASMTGASYTASGSIIGFIMRLPYIVGFVLLPAALTYYVVMTWPYWVAGLIAVFTRHPAAKLIEESVKKERPDEQLLGELAAIMERQDIDGDRVMTLLKQVSPIRQYIWTIRNKKRLKEALRLQAVVKSKYEAEQAESQLARDALLMERERNIKTGYQSDIGRGGGR
ncbi:MAG: hypothetical protein R3F54_25460 [Alphaproteobacteria bacterium]